MTDRARHGPTRRLLEGLGVVLVSPLILLVLLGGFAEMGLGTPGVWLAGAVYLVILGLILTSLRGVARDWWRSLG
jgi:hypothetical protein